MPDLLADLHEVLGISGLVPILYSPWWEVVLFAVMAVNLASVWWRGRSSGRMAGFHLVASGAVAIVATKIGLLPEQAAMPGVMLTLAGSLASVWITRLQPRQLLPGMRA